MYSGYLNLLWSSFPEMFVVKINAIYLHTKYIVYLLRQMQLR